MKETLFILALLCCLTGCSLLYERTHEGLGFTIYSDQPEKVTNTVGQHIRLIRHAYQTLFNLSNHELPHLRLFLKGNGLDQERLEPGGTLGCYLKFFDWIIVNGQYPDVMDQIETVLLHELAHFFATTDYSEISERCWLNEGLAGVLECTLYERWHFEYMLFNPFLFESLCQHEWITIENFEKTLKADWEQFNRPGDKSRHYAIAWSIAYYLLSSHLNQTKPLGERIKILYSLEEEEILKLAHAWKLYFTDYDSDKWLAELAKDPSPQRRLLRRWASDSIELRELKKKIQDVLHRR